MFEYIASYFPDKPKTASKEFPLLPLLVSYALKGQVSHICSAAAAKSLQSCPTLRPHRRQPARLPHPWDSPGKNTGVGCHFLLQCMKVKSESEVAQSCPTLRDRMDCSPTGSSIHGVFQARVLEWGAIAFSDICSGSPMIPEVAKNFWY